MTYGSTFKTASLTSNAFDIIQKDYACMYGAIKIMSFPLGLPPTETRPLVQRSRSHTGPTARVTTDGREVPHPKDNRSRLHQSPTEQKPRNANTLPPSSEVGKSNEKTSRLHLRGSHHRHHNQHDSDGNQRRHRYTQSDVQQMRSSWRSRDDNSLPHLVAGLNAERERKATGTAGTHSALLTEKHALNENRNALPGGLAKTTSTRLYRPIGPQHTAGIAGDASYLSTLSDGRHGLRRRATSDPKEPVRVPQKAKTDIEIAFERAERARMNKYIKAKPEDITRRNKELKQAEDEIRDRIAEINLAGSEVTRRLDYTYYNLLEKAGDLVGMISNFQSLSKESQQLISNFDTETERLDTDIRRRIGNFRTDFDKRTERGEMLEKRGKTAANKAEDLGIRLETARTAVENWVQREDKSKQVWLRFWSFIWWTFIALVIVFLTILIGKEWWFRGDPVKAGLSVPAGGNRNASLALGEGKKGDDLLAEAHLPEDVRIVLQDIEKRNQKRKSVFVKPAAMPGDDENHQVEEQRNEDKRLRLLDEL